MRRMEVVWGVPFVLHLLSLPTFAAKEAVPILYTGEKYRDPTVSPLSATLLEPAKEEKIVLPRLDVQGIVWDERDPRAG